MDMLGHVRRELNKPHTEPIKTQPQDAVAIYNELRDKAYEDVVMQMQISDNTIAGAGTLFQDYSDYGRDSKTVLAYAFKVNGVEHKGNATVDTDKIRNTFHDGPVEAELFKALFEEMTNQIRDIIITDVLTYGRIPPHERTNNNLNIPTMEERMNSQISRKPLTFP